MREQIARTLKRFSDDYCKDMTKEDIDNVLNRVEEKISKNLHNTK